MTYKNESHRYLMRQLERLLERLAEGGPIGWACFETDKYVVTVEGSGVSLTPPGSPASTSDYSE